MSTELVDDQKTLVDRPSVKKEIVDPICPKGSIQCIFYATGSLFFVVATLFQILKCLDICIK